MTVDSALELEASRVVLAEDVTLSEIGRRCGVGRVAAKNWWRRSYARWPAPVGGDERSPRFFWPDVERVLVEDGRLAEERPTAPAVVVLAGGAVLLLHDPHVLVRNGFGELGGYAEAPGDLPVPFPYVDLELAEVGGERFSVEQADVDISYTGSAFFAFVRFVWLLKRQSAVA